MTRTKGYLKRLATLSRHKAEKEYFKECPNCKSHIKPEFDICPICFYPIGLKNSNSDIYSICLTRGF